MYSYCRSWPQIRRSGVALLRLTKHQVGSEMVWPYQRDSNPFCCIRTNTSWGQGCCFFYFYNKVWGGGRKRNGSATTGGTSLRETKSETFLQLIAGVFKNATALPPCTKPCSQCEAKPYTTHSNGGLVCHYWLQPCSFEAERSRHFHRQVNPVFIICLIN